MSRTQTSAAPTGGQNQNSYPLGFRAAHPEARFLAKFDNDARAEPEWMERVIAAMEDDDSIGSVACLTLDYHDPALIYSMGDGFLPNGDAFNIGRGMVYRPDLPSAKWVFGPSGCTAVYRRSALDRVGLLDEDFWAYHEDVDLNFRMQLAGYKSLYVPEAIAYHAGSVTGKQFGDRSLLASGRNRWFVLYKNLPAALWMRFAYRLARRQAQVAWWWIKGNAESRVRCRGALSSLQYLGRELRKRRAIMRLRRASATELAQMFRAHERLQRQLSEIARNQK